MSINAGQVRRLLGPFAIIATLALILFAVAAPVAATENTKWFVCKYVGTPGVDETLQTGQNPISVSESAISISPVVAGVFFNDSHGRSYVLVEDTGQDEPDPSECPPANSTSTPTPTPSPTPTASPTPEGSVAEGTSTPTPEGSVQGGTGTPAPSQPDTAMGTPGAASPIPAIGFGMILLAALGTLAWANVKSARSRA